jgi:hypothetical protein
MSPFLAKVVVSILTIALIDRRDLRNSCVAGLVNMQFPNFYTSLSTTTYFRSINVDYAKAVVMSQVKHSECNKKGCDSKENKSQEPRQGEGLECMYLQTGVHAATRS